MTTQKVYMDNQDQGLIMLYDHEWGFASWGKGWYEVDFEAIKQFWIYVGGFE